MRKEELKKYYKEQIEGHRDTERYSMTNPGYIELMKYLRSKIPKKGKILEIGCNTGYECVAMQSNDRGVVGIDIGANFVEHAKSIGVDARVMDMHELKFTDGSFDCIYINNTIEHAYDPKKVLAEMFRALKKGGIAVICIPADYKNPDYIPTENWNQRLHLWKPDREEFIKAVEHAGFEVKFEEVNAKELFGLENRASYNNYMVVVCKKS